MSQMTTEDELAQDVEKMKAEQYAELREQFESGEITQEELEERMDRLFESGDEFLDVDPDARDMSETVDEVKFQARQIGEVIALAAIVVAFGLAALFTMGRALVLGVFLLVILFAFWKVFD